MPLQHTPIDFIAYNADGTVVLLAQAKSWRGTLESWAVKLRRNILNHGVLPRAKYFLIATPERIYGWRQENLPASEVPPQFTIDADQALAPYFDSSSKHNLGSYTIIRFHRIHMSLEVTLPSL